MKLKLLETPSRAGSVEHEVEHSISAVVAVNPLRADVVRAKAREWDQIARTQMQVRGEISFRILAVAEKYAPRSRSEAIAALVERTIASYPVVNDILAR